MDTWSRDQVEFMKSVGNKNSNASLNPDEFRNPPPTAIDESERGSQLEKFIRAKYETFSFATASTIPPARSQSQSPTENRRPSSASPTLAVAPPPRSSRSPSTSRPQRSISPTAFRPSSAQATSASHLPSADLLPPTLPRRPASAFAQAPPRIQSPPPPLPSVNSSPESIKHVRFARAMEAIQIRDFDEDDEDGYDPPTPPPLPPRIPSRQWEPPAKGILRPRSGGPSISVSSATSPSEFGLGRPSTNGFDSLPTNGTGLGMGGSSLNPFGIPYPQRSVSAQATFGGGDGYSPQPQPAFSASAIGAGGMNGRSMGMGMSTNGLEDKSMNGMAKAWAAPPVPQPVVPAQPTTLDSFASIWDDLGSISGAGTPASGGGGTPAGYEAPSRLTQTKTGTQALRGTNPNPNGGGYSSSGGSGSVNTYQSLSTSNVNSRPAPAAAGIQHSQSYFPSQSTSGNSSAFLSTSQPSFLSANGSTSSYQSQSHSLAPTPSPSFQPQNPAPAPLRPQQTGFVPSSAFGQQLLQEQSRPVAAAGYAGLANFQQPQQTGFPSQTQSQLQPQQTGYRPQPSFMPPTQQPQQTGFQPQQQTNPFQSSMFSPAPQQQTQQFQPQQNAARNPFFGMQGTNMGHFGGAGINQNGGAMGGGGTNPFGQQFMTGQHQQQPQQGFWTG
ncbi:hypothetical protein P7C70_g1921, partial [Phenoliferia sp. Uapishka_3]